MNLFIDIKQRTEAWVALRQSGPPGNPYPVAVGASEMADAIGLNGAAAQRVLWARKSGVAPEKESNWAMQKGAGLEPAIHAAYEQRYGGIGGPMLCYDERWPFILASLDWISDDRDVVSEFKFHNAEAHAEVIAGKVPAINAVQLQVQLLCSGADVSHLVSVGSRGYMAMVVVLPAPDDWRLPWAFIVEEAGRFCAAVRDGVEPDWPASQGRLYAWGAAETGDMGKALAGALVETVARQRVRKEDGEMPRGNELFTLSGKGETREDTSISAQEPSGAESQGVTAGKGETRPLDDASATGGAIEAQVERVPAGEAVSYQPGDAIVEVPALGPARPHVLLAHFVAQRDELITRATKIVVCDDESEAEAVVALKQLTSIPKMIDDARLETTKPLRDWITKINAAADVFLAPLKDAKTYVNAQLTARADQKRIAADVARRDAERRQAEAAAEAAKLRAEGNAEAAQEVIAQAKAEIPLPVTGPAIKGNATGRQPSYTITDPDEVERAYCSPDASKIKGRMTEMWKAFKGDEERFGEWAAKQKGLAFIVETKTKAR